MPIRTKLLFSFLLLTILILVQFVVSYYFSQKEYELVQQIIREHDISNQLSGLAQAAQKIRRYEKEYFIYVQNEEKRDKYFESFQKTRQEINRFIALLKKKYPSANQGRQQRILAEWSEITEFYASGFEKVHEQVLSGEISGIIEANAAIKDAKNRFRVVLSGSRDEINQQLKRAKSEANQVYQYLDRSSLIFTVVTDVSILIGLFISFQVPRSIARPIKELTEISDNISKGRMNKPVKVSGSREIEELAKSIERLRVATQGLLKRLQMVKKTAG